MFDISTRLVSEQDEISGLETIGWRIIHGSILSLDWWWTSHHSSTHEGLRLFGFCVVPGRFSKTSIERCKGTKIGMVKIFFKIQKLDRIDDEPMVFSGIFSQDSIRCSSVKKSKRLLFRLDETPEKFTGRILFMSMLNDISCGSKDNEKECWKMPNSYLCTRGDLEKDNGHLLVLVLKRSGTVSVKTVHREYGQYCWKDVRGIRRKRMSNFPCYDSIVQRSTQSKGHVNCRYTMQSTRKRLRLFFA